MKHERDPLYYVLQANDQTNRRRQSVRAAQIALCLVAFAVAMVFLRAWMDAERSGPPPQGTHGGVTVNP